MPNISKSKGNQTMILGQLLECNVRKNFLETSWAKYGGETILRLFSKKSKLSIALDQWFKVLYSLFLLNAKLRVIKIYWN